MRAERKIPRKSEAQSYILRLGCGAGEKWALRFCPDEKPTESVLSELQQWMNGHFDGREKHLAAQSKPCGIRSFSCKERRSCMITGKEKHLAAQAKRYGVGSFSRKKGRSRMITGREKYLATGEAQTG